MPAIADSIRSVLKYCCIASIPLLAACGDDGGDGEGPAVAARCGPATVTVPTPPAPPPGAPPAGITLQLEQINDSLSAPLFVTAAPGDDDRLFVVEQVGTIQILNRNTGAPIGT